MVHAESTIARKEKNMRYLTGSIANTVLEKSCGMVASMFEMQLTSNHLCCNLAQSSRMKFLALTLHKY